MNTNEEASLVWIADKRVFLKIQKGAGDGLDSEDVANGFVDYVLWNVFNPGEIDIDESWDPLYVRGGVLMFKQEITVRDSLPDVYKAVFGYDLTPNGNVVLLYTA